MDDDNDERREQLMSRLDKIERLVSALREAALPPIADASFAGL
jgi:hypothetical protein